MPHPWLHDDGATVTLDLHGASVDEALDLARRTVQTAVLRGRTSVKVIHGASPSRRLAPNRSIREALYEELSERSFGVELTGSVRSEAYILLSLHLAQAADPRTLRLSDLTS